MIKAGDMVVRGSLPFFEEPVEVKSVEQDGFVWLKGGGCGNPTTFIPVEGYTGPFGEGRKKRAARPDFDSYLQQVKSYISPIRLNDPLMGDGEVIQDFVSNVFIDIFIRGMKMKEGARFVQATDHIIQSFDGNGFSVAMFLGGHCGVLGVGLCVLKEAPDENELKRLAKAKWHSRKQPLMQTCCYQAFRGETLNELIDYLRYQLQDITPAQRERG